MATRGNVRSFSLSAEEADSVLILEAAPPDVVKSMSRYFGDGMTSDEQTHGGNLYHDSDSGDTSDSEDRFFITQHTLPEAVRSVRRHLPEDRSAPGVSTEQFEDKDSSGPHIESTSTDVKYGRRYKWKDSPLKKFSFPFLEQVRRPGRGRATSVKAKNNAVIVASAVGGLLKYANASKMTLSDVAYLVDGCRSSLPELEEEDGEEVDDDDEDDDDIRVVKTKVFSSRIQHQDRQAWYTPCRSKDNRAASTRKTKQKQMNRLNCSTGGSPTGGSPIGGSPTRGSPIGGSPTRGSPIGGSPTRGSPIGGSPTRGSPIGGSPTRGSPIGGSPTRGSPIGWSPIEVSPTGGSPTGGSPTRRSHTGGSPIGGSPTRGSPIGGSPTRGSPIGGSPTRGSPIGWSPIEVSPTGGSPTGGSPTGGSRTGGSPIGGSPTGASPTGGSSTGGSPTKGFFTGGSPIGGSPTGGSPIGGSPTGGSPTRGFLTGGSPTGGSPIGGSPIGGSPTGGSPTGRSPNRGSYIGGSPTGGSPTVGSPTQGSPIRGPPIGSHIHPEEKEEQKEKEKDQEKEKEQKEVEKEKATEKPLRRSRRIAKGSIKTTVRIRKARKKTPRLDTQSEDIEEDNLVLPKDLKSFFFHYLALKSVNNSRVEHTEIPQECGPKESPAKPMEASGSSNVFTHMEGEVSNHEMVRKKSEEEGGWKRHMEATAVVSQGDMAEQTDALPGNGTMERKEKVESKRASPADNDDEEVGQGEGTGLPSPLVEDMEPRGKKRTTKDKADRTKLEGIPGKDTAMVEERLTEPSEDTVATSPGEVSLKKKKPVQGRDSAAGEEPVPQVKGCRVQVSMQELDAAEKLLKLESAEQAPDTLLRSASEYGDAGSHKRKKKMNDNTAGEVEPPAATEERNVENRDHDEACKFPPKESHGPKDSHAKPTEASGSSNVSTQMEGKVEAEPNRETVQMKGEKEGGWKRHVEATAVVSQGDMTEQTEVLPGNGTMERKEKVESKRASPADNDDEEVGQGEGTGLPSPSVEDMEPRGKKKTTKDKADRTKLEGIPGKDTAMVEERLTEPSEDTVATSPDEVSLKKKKPVQGRDSAAGEEPVPQVKGCRVQVSMQELDAAEKLLKLESAEQAPDTLLRSASEYGDAGSHKRKKKMNDNTAGEAEPPAATEERNVENRDHDEACKFPSKESNAKPTEASGSSNVSTQMEGKVEAEPNRETVQMKGEEEGGWKRHVEATAVVSQGDMTEQTDALPGDGTMEPREKLKEKGERKRDSPAENDDEEVGQGEGTGLLFPSVEDMEPRRKKKTTKEKAKLEGIPGKDTAMVEERLTEPSEDTVATSPDEVSSKKKKPVQGKDSAAGEEPVPQVKGCRVQVSMQELDAAEKLLKREAAEQAPDTLSSEYEFGDAGSHKRKKKRKKKMNDNTAGEVEPPAATEERKRKRDDDDDLRPESEPTLVSAEDPEQANIHLPKERKRKKDEVGEEKEVGDAIASPGTTHSCVEELLGEGKRRRRRRRRKDSGPTDGGDTVSEGSCDISPVIHPALPQNDETILPASKTDKKKKSKNKKRLHNPNQDLFVTEHKLLT